MTGNLLLIHVSQCSLVQITLSDIFDQIVLLRAANLACKSENVMVIQTKLRFPKQMFPCKGHSELQALANSLFPLIHTKTTIYGFFLSSSVIINTFFDSFCCETENFRANLCFTLMQSADSK